jgi:hypothetical protein
VEEVPEDEGEAYLPLSVFCLFAVAERLVTNPVLQIVWIYVIIKLMIDLMQSMTMIL